MGKHSKPTRKHIRRALLGISIAATATTVQPASAAPLTTLHGIAWCESNDNPIAVNSNSGASGLFQFLSSTWANYGGYSQARYAPVSVQIQKASSMPLSAWNASISCWGSGKYDGKPFPGDTAVPKHGPIVVAPKVIEPKSEPLAPVTVQYYTVKPGDSLWKIANGPAWPKLYAVNRATIGANPNLIFPGQQLVR